MAVRGEEVASAIDAHVRESIEKMVSEIRSSIEDVREVVDQQLKAALQSVQADVNSVTFRPAIQKAIAALEEGLASAAPAAAADAGRLKRAVQVVERGKSQVDVLNALLEQCLEFGSRAALLILRGETFSGWKGVGFASHGGNDEMIKRFNAAPGLIPQLDDVLRNERVCEWDGSNLSTRFGVAASARAILVPMVIKDKVAAAVYVDVTAEETVRLDGSSIELLVFMTGLLVDTLAMRKKSPSPSLSDSSAGAATTRGESTAPGMASSRAAALAPPPPRPVPVAPPPPPRPAPPAPAAPHAAESPDSTVAFSAQQIRDMMAAPAPAKPTFVPPPEPVARPLPPLRPAPAPTPAPAPAAAPVGAAAVSAHEERATTQFIPPPGVAPRGGFAVPQGEEAKRHDEARRFARLLVSEIKLYNESKVDQGRRNRDLYERMKEDIDRSRQMYDERIPEEVRKTSNYFYDELVRILAEGNAESLGL
jgi:hypothetical protein